MNDDTPDWRDEELGNGRFDRTGEGRGNNADRATGRSADPRFTDTRPAQGPSEARDGPRGSSPRERLSADYDDEPVFRRRAASSGLNAFLGSDAMTRRLVYGAAAIGAVLVLGVGGWSLLGSHSGGIPVIGPPPGPVRDRPADPGGMQIMGDGTDLDVTGQGEAHLAPEPEQPRPDALAARTAPESSVPAAGTPVGSAAAPPADTTPTHVEPDGSATGQETSENTLPHGAGARTPDDTSAKPAELPPVVAQHTAPAPDEQVARHDENQVDRAVAKPRTEPQTAKTQPDAAGTKHVTTGDHMVQLAALGSDADAKALWARLSRQAADLLGDRNPVIEQKTINGRVFYRLRVSGFETTQAAKAFCVRLHARSVACTPAVF